jgi:hypothetical protein
MTPRQEQTFSELLAIGATRPYAPTDLVEHLRERLTLELAEPLSRWTERTLWMSKSGLSAVSRCEGSFRADRAAPRSSGKQAVTVVGDLAHLAIQLAYTHPGRPVAEYVRHSIAKLRSSDEDTEQFWAIADIASQSDITMSAISRVTAYLDSWPPLQDTWDPRFEENIHAKVGRLTLAARVDLLLGRPRGSGQQSMLIADWKSGALNDAHPAEAMYHALLVTLSFGVPPFRSTVYSLASGEFTDPDVTGPRLHAAVDHVVAGVTATVDVLTERRPPQVFCGTRWCAYCTENGITEPVQPEPPSGPAVTSDPAVTSGPTQVSTDQLVAA